METPSSTARRLTRSVFAASNNTINSSGSSNSIPISKKIEDSDKNLSKTRQQQQQDRSALIDITNDSPIVGLANGNGGVLETPLSSIGKQRGKVVKKTPGSGEALLRGQVKTLLQKVEEEAEISKLSMEVRPFIHLNNSPMTLLAPTPANTPQIPNLCVNGSLNNFGTGLVKVSSPVVPEHLISQVVNKENPESEKSVITRSLFFDFSEKSEISDCSSGVTYQEVEQEKHNGSTEEDDSSVWSMQVNASTTNDEYDDDEEMDEEEDQEEEEEEDYDDVEEECDDDEGLLLLSELCEGLNNISVNEKVDPKFAGKHTRFVYNSDDELVEEEVEDYADSSNVLCLKGLPTPKGKHLRFSEDEEEKSVL